MQRLFFKILHTHLSTKHLLGFSLVSIIGMTLLFSATCFYQDTSSWLKQQEKALHPTTLVIHKPINLSHNTLNTINGFTAAEIKDLRRQPFVTALDTFSAAHYNVIASFRLSSPLYAPLFFEAIDSSFLDIHPAHWTFDAKQSTVPIIIPRSYLTIYNTAFAINRDLPLLDEDYITQLPITLQLYNTHQQTLTYQGQIVGFSDNINTLLVPSQFITHTNRILAPHAYRNPSRIIIRATDPSDQHIQTYLTQKGYKVEQTPLNNSEARYLFNIISVTLLSFGIAIFLLSLYILTLSLNLLIHRATKDFKQLYILGYKPTQIYRPLYLTLLIMTLISLLTAAAISHIIQQKYLTLIHQIQPTFHSTPLTYLYLLLCGSALLTLIYLLTRRQLKKI